MKSFRNRYFRIWLPMLVVAVVSRGAVAEDLGRARAAIVEEVRNERPGFIVRVDVDHKNRIYREDEMLSISVKSERRGYLYLIYCQADDKVVVLFPNKHQRDNQIPAGKEIHVPPREGATFQIRVGRPLGDEVLKAIVSSEPLKELDAKSLTQNVMVDVGYGTVKAAYVEGLRDEPASWGEHYVKIKTVAKDARIGEHKPRRFGIFIGISQYKDRSIQQLAVCDNDATSLCDAMTLKGALDQTFLLRNEEATLANIEAIIRTLTELSSPGDEIFIFWSGHGGRCADTNDDEKDGLDEYLVPWDAILNNYSTMLVDDQFGRWIQELDGRKIVVILDTCHSAGQATNEKGIARYGKGISTDAKFAKAIGGNGGAVDFLDGEFARTKDIGQKEAAILASSRAAQVSFERREGDLSTMTYFLVNLIESSEGPVTLEQAFQHLSVKVPEYVKVQFPGATQEPVLVDQTSPPLFLRP
ncbi:MAG: DUF4384 domain-containing protein [Planctomycetota bacterium]